MSAEPLVINPRDPAFVADPYPLYRRLRNEAPVHWWEQGHMWMLSRYEDVEATLKDPRLGTDPRSWRLYREQNRDAMPPELTEYYDHRLYLMERDDHQRMRKLVIPSFTSRAAAKREDLVQQIVDELIAAMGDEEVIDFMPRFAALLPIRVISRILGIPAEHEARFLEFTDILLKVTFPLTSPQEQQAIAQRFPEGYRLLWSIVQDHRQTPRDDLLGSLIAAELDGDRLSDLELVSLMAGLVTAGSETTVHLLAFAVLELLRHPQVLAEVHEDLDRLPGVIEEVLRHDNFGGLGVPRYALEDLEIRGQRIAKGDMVLCMLAAAMHDEQVWPDAERFGMDREPSLNLSFGRGTHFCLGAHLARTETRVALRSLLTRFPHLELAGDPVFRPNPIVRQVTSLPLRLRPAGS